MEWPRLNKLFILFGIILFNPINLFAVEYYLFFDSKCGITDGLITNASYENTTIVTRNGNIQTLKNSDIKGILVYNFISSPVKKFKLSSKSNAVLKKVVIRSKDEEKSFNGFPVQFIEDLVVFIDTKGQTHVHSYNNIFKLRPIETQSTKMSSNLSNDTLSLRNKGYIQSCETKNNDLTLEGIKPNRILADKIRINNFLENIINGYDQLASFEEKTYVYARPLVYDKKTRLNLNFGSKALEQSSVFSNNPFFPSLEWSSGDPYRVQSNVVIGTDYVEYSENIDPMMAIRSELKAHFFHASFIGNLNAMEAGKKYYVKQFGLDFIQDNDDIVDLEQFDTHFNYMILMGFDYSKFSVSAGLYYPLYLFQSNDKISEVLSTDSGYLGRFMYTTQKMRYYITAAIKDEDSNNPNEENLITYSGGSIAQNSISKFNVESFSLRGGFDLDVRENMKTGISLLYLKGEYADTSSALGGSKLTFSRLGAFAYFGQDFGDYIGLRLNVKYVANDLEGVLHSENIKNEESGFGFDGVFSIIF